jgi:glyoxylase-like metal-dependent hydrolase (beta-lactamase superfamily II)
VRQVQRLGMRPEEVQNILLTHLHFDHAGGLPDFPWATVHLHRREYEALLHPKTWMERFAYDHKDFAHKPNWVLYENACEKWLDFDAIPLPFSPRMYLIPLFGHTSGHCGVAIKDGAGWIFQTADAMPLNAQLDLTPAWLNRLILGPHVPRLSEFMAKHPEVRVLSGHTWRTIFRENNEL